MKFQIELRMWIFMERSKFLRNYMGYFIENLSKSDIGEV